jgi:DNA polymerase III alpha subunit (gram-positive type)
MTIIRDEPLVGVEHHNRNEAGQKFAADMRALGHKTGFAVCCACLCRWSHIVEAKESTSPVDLARLTCPKCGAKSSFFDQDYE